MTVLHLARKIVTEDDVLRAWATHQALQLAEVDNPKLANDLSHQQAVEEAKAKFMRLYDEWSRQC
jgi:myo-inositol catabolism protein IolC